MIRTFRGRIGLALGLTAFASVLVAALVTVGLLRTFAERSAREDLRRLARAVAVSPDAIDRDAVGLAQVRRVLQVSGDEMAVVRREGLAVSGTPTGTIIARQLDLSSVFSDGGERSGTIRAAGEEYVYIVAPIARRAVVGDRVGVVVLARPLRLARTLAGPMIARVGLAALGATLLAIAASTLIARRLDRPVRDLSIAATRMAAGDLEQSVSVPDDDEFGGLARTFNDLSRALSEARRREREFLASVSHELRTPITSIRGYAEALADGALPDEARRADALRIIVDESDRLERMIRDVMDLARLGARNFTLDLRDADLVTTLAEASRAHRPQAEAAGVTLADDLPDALPLRTDPDRVRQIVSNLIENALRVTDAGGTVRLAAGATETGGAWIEVGDTGPGIAREDLPHVFERSYLWRESKGKQAVGTGLGLAIVRELIGALGGRVEVRSASGQGTTFRLTLPPGGSA